MTRKKPLDGDLPRSHPSTDLFGYFPFAQRIAAAITDLNSPAGVVLAITGEWGAGKSTLLNFIRRELSNAQVSPYPAIVDFNPWWFSSRDDLAAQMIRALRDRMAGDRFSGIDISSALTKYAESIGSTAEKFGGFFGKVGAQTLMKLIGKAPPSLSELKRSIAKELAGEGQKYVFFVDDIDRLAPTEVVELFRAVKALGDFPNVVYVLAFDRRIVAESISSALSTDGNAYLEKIVQAVFPIPAIDRLTLRKWLFEQMDLVLTSTPGAEFDQIYWSGVYFDGLDALFTRPRDVVRFVNTLSITYPSVAGEVNPVDFIAVEALRVFSPLTYEVIRGNAERFSGRAHKSKEDGADDKAFHENWLNGVNDRDVVERVLRQVFPKFGSVRDDFFFHSGRQNWRRALRLCDPEIFPTYFQFAVPEKIASNSLLGELKLVSTHSVSEARDVLLSSAKRRNAAGVAQIGDLIERLADDEEDISRQAISNLLFAVLQVGDEIALAAEPPIESLFEESGIQRLTRLVTRLVADVPEEDRVDKVARAFESSDAISLLVWVVGSIRRVLTGVRPTSNETRAFAKFSYSDLLVLQDTVASKFASIPHDNVLMLPGLDVVVNQLLLWGEKNAVRSRIVPLLVSMQSLPRALEQLATTSRIHSSADPRVRKKARLDPRMFDRFVDRCWIDEVVQACGDFDGLSDFQRDAVDSYLRARLALAHGKPLDGFWNDDA